MEALIRALVNYWGAFDSLEYREGHLTFEGFNVYQEHGLYVIRNVGSIAGTYLEGESEVIKYISGRTSND